MRYCLIIVTLLCFSCVSNPSIKSIKDLDQESGYMSATFSITDDRGEFINKDSFTCLLRLKNINTSKFETILLNELNNIEVYNLDIGEYIVTSIGLYNSTININFPNSFRERKYLEIIPIELIKKIEIKKNQILYLGHISIRKPNKENPRLVIKYIDDYENIKTKNNSALEIQKL